MVSSHALEILGDGGDAIGFLDAQFGGVAHYEPFFAARAEHREHRDFVDQSGSLGLFEHATSERANFRISISPMSSPDPRADIQDFDLRAHARPENRAVRNASDSVQRREW